MGQFIRETYLEEALKKILHPKGADMIFQASPTCAFVVWAAEFLHHRHISYVFHSKCLIGWTHIQMSSEISKHCYPSQTHDTTLISTVLQPSRPDWSHTFTNFSDSAWQSCGFHCQSQDARWRESNRVCKRENVCDSDCGIYWVIALSFESLHISGWVNLALMSSAIREDDRK